LSKVGKYEGMFLLDSARATREWDVVQAHVHDILKKHGAEITKSEKWSERRLAYDIRGHKRGVYMLTYFTAPGEAIRLINRDCELSDVVIRNLIIVDEPKKGKAAVPPPPPDAPAASPTPAAPAPPATTPAAASAAPAAEKPKQTT